MSIVALRQRLLRQRLLRSAMITTGIKEPKMIIKVTTPKLSRTSGMLPNR